jgi:hypothetical protein
MSNCPCSELEEARKHSPTGYVHKQLYNQITERYNDAIKLLKEIESPGVVIDGQVFVNYDLKDRIKEFLNSI